MATSPKIYSRLTRNASGVGSYSSLWLAADHLMIVRSTGYSETYLRMQLNEMKAVFLTGTNRRLWSGIVWGLILAVGVLILVLQLSSRGSLIFPIILSIAAGGALLWNHLLGEGCRAYVLTGVQTAELPALVRLKKARRVVAQLQPMIAAAQANLVSSPPAVPPPASPPLG